MDSPPPAPPPFHDAAHSYFLAFRDQQRKKDSEHLNLLEIFHYIAAGFAILAMAYIIMNIMMMSYIFDNQRVFAPPSAPSGSPGSGASPMPPGFPKQLMDIMRWVYAGIGSLFAILAAGNVLSAVFMRRREFRAFSLAVAGVNCLMVPLGTVLGVFTIMVLLRESVRETYEATPH